MNFENVYFITGTAYAGKSTMVKLLAQKFDGIACEGDCKIYKKNKDKYGYKVFQ